MPCWICLAASLAFSLMSCLMCLHAPRVSAQLELNSSAFENLKLEQEAGMVSAMNRGVCEYDAGFR
jgi:hypothetical protein